MVRARPCAPRRPWPRWTRRRSPATPSALASWVAGGADAAGRAVHQHGLAGLAAGPRTDQAEVHGEVVHRERGAGRGRRPGPAAGTPEWGAAIASSAYPPMPGERRDPVARLEAACRPARRGRRRPPRRPARTAGRACTGRGRASCQHLGERDAGRVAPRPAPGRVWAPLWLGEVDGRGTAAGPSRVTICTARMPVTVPGDTTPLDHPSRRPPLGGGPRQPAGWPGAPRLRSRRP